MISVRKGEPHRRRPAKARQLLKEAGYDDQHPLPEVTLLFNTNEMHKAVAEALQAMWKENLGVDVNITNQESKVFMATRAQGDYQLARRRGSPITSTHDLPRRLCR